ncbi:MAG: FG-GAP repeat protein, partial [Planctomycetales bacterium]|nr:FG-GAP repeat protein [Planctomycetales bacterium]
MFRKVAGVWQQIAKLIADDAASTDEFGASISVSGDTAVIGVRLDDDDGNASGSAYMFREVAGVWQQIAKLTADDAAADDQFGNSVALSGDTAVIGALLDNDGGSESGSAYVFRELGGVWQQVAKLTANDAAAGDSFGSSVAINGDMVVIGADRDDDGGLNSGSAYVFRELGGVWQEIAKLTAADATADDHFGYSVSLSGDTAVIGAYFDDGGSSNSGSAYVFREVAGVWQQIAKLTAADAGANDRFGWSVSHSGDTAVIGAFFDDDGGNNSGSAYVFRELGGEWQQVAKLTTADATADDRFGYSVSVSGDTALIGAYFDDDGGINSGSAYVFDVVSGPVSLDFNSNGIPDECENDCNLNGVTDDIDIAGPTSEDCNLNELPDECELAGNDCNANTIPDECETDCNNNGTPDDCEVFADCNSNAIPDECELVGNDCNGNAVPDECDPDCNSNSLPDDCELFDDCNNNAIPDECELDGNDCNANTIPDECEID